MNTTIIIMRLDINISFNISLRCRYISILYLRQKNGIYSIFIQNTDICAVMATCVPNYVICL